VASQQIQVGWWSFIIFEAVFFSFCIAYLLGGIARERIVLWYKHASLIDPLTGVGNRRAFLERGENLLHRTAFDRRPAALLLFDLDKFKSVNDTFGHHAGDRVLTVFCGIATAALRPGDLFGRLGGEEFAALLPHASFDSGLAVAERIRAKLEGTALDFGASTLTTTVSIGVAVSADRVRNLAALLMAADRALYRAKANGRNRIECERIGSEVGIESINAAPHRMPG
jgi:diguanylate cyclase (GGDEF)-like protein